MLIPGSAFGRLSAVTMMRRARHLRQAIQIDRTSAWAYASLGDVMMKQGNLEDAITYYRQALSQSNASSVLRNSNAHSETHNSLGLALEQQGNLERCDRWSFSRRSH